MKNGIIFILICVFQSCQKQERTYTLTSVTSHNFYGTRESLMSRPILERFDIAFQAMTGLKQFDVSDTLFELRILYGNLIYDRLLVWKVNGMKSVISVFDCRMEDIGDSLYLNMKEELEIVDSKISHTAMADIVKIKQSISNISSLTDSREDPYSLDDGEHFYLQFNSKSLQKKIFICDPLVYQKEGSKSAIELIHMLNILKKDFQISFRDYWNVLLAKANVKR